MFNRLRTSARYIDPLTSFGFKRLFGSEYNKALLIDFLNAILPEEHAIGDLSFHDGEKADDAAFDREAVFDIYCTSERGERFLVELQRVRQNFFGKRSVYYETFPILDQAKQEKYRAYRLSSVYAVGVLDFVFNDCKTDGSVLRTVRSAEQKGEVFYDGVQFVSLELPKFKKTIGELESQFDKWLFLLKHLSDLEAPPDVLKKGVFERLFEVAEISQLSVAEQNAYADSLKYYWDLNNVVNTARQDGFRKGFEEGRRIAKAGSVMRLLERRLGELPEDSRVAVEGLSVRSLESLSEALLEFSDLADLANWLALQ